MISVFCSPKISLKTRTFDPGSLRILQKRQGEYYILSQTMATNSWKVLRAFILEEFKTLLGFNWVINGRYQLMIALENRFLASHNWSSSVSPGTTTIMSIVVRSPFTGSLNSEVYVCPESRYPGSWEKGIIYHGRPGE